MSEIPISVMPWHRPDPCKPARNQTEAAFKATYLDYLAALRLDSAPLAVPLTGVMCTIGPASKQTDMLVDMMQQGMTLAMVPLSLGVRQDHVDTVTQLRTANTAFNLINNRAYPLGVAVQLKGPGLRIGGLKKDVAVELPLQHRITLTTDKAWRTKGTEHILYISFPEMCHVLNEGDHILLDLGVVMLVVETIDQNEAVCQVVGAGVIHSYMSVAVPDVPLRLPDLTEEDVDDLRLAVSLGVDIVVATRTRVASHIQDVRRVLDEEERGSGILVWAQIETKEGLDNLDSILEEADAILLSRVSLTQDLSPEKLFLAQKKTLASCNKAGVPVFVSSHFLPSMQKNLEPSIAELNDVANAVLDGVDGFLLRNTTSTGRHPEQTVRTLVKTCLEAEAAVWHYQTFSFLNKHAPPPIDPTHAIAISAVEAALKSCATAILLCTTSGRSAQLVAKYRPRCPIIAVTRYGQVARQLNSWRAVLPLHFVDPPLPDWAREVDVRLQYGIEFAKHQGVVSPGDCLVLMNGWRQGAGFTNTIRIVYASDSFPWVYPHQLPKERAREVSTPRHSSGGSRTFSKVAAGMSASRQNSLGHSSSTVLQSLTKQRRSGSHPLMSRELTEEEFKSNVSSKSKEFSHSGLMSSEPGSNVGSRLDSRLPQSQRESLQKEVSLGSKDLEAAKSQKSKDTGSTGPEESKDPGEGELQKQASQKSRDLDEDVAESF